MNDKELLGKARKLLETTYNADRENRVSMIDDIAFTAGRQWSKEDRAARGDRPTLTINKINQSIKLATGDIRNNPHQLMWNLLMTKGIKTLLWCGRSL